MSRQKQTNKRTTTRQSRGGPKRTKKAKLVTKVISKIEEKITNDELKPTVGDLIRLLQFERELTEEEQPKEIKVSWVDPDGAGDAASEG